MPVWPGLELDSQEKVPGETADYSVSGQVTSPGSLSGSSRDLLESRAEWASSGPRGGAQGARWASSRSSADPKLCSLA